MAQGMTELGNNAAVLKGFPLVQYVSMSMKAEGQASTNQNTQSSDTATSSADMPTSASAAMMKGLGGFFSKHKNKDTSADSSTQNLPPRPSNPGSLMDMTLQVTSFSDATLDNSVFEIPAGYTQIQADPDQLVGNQAHH
jgi:hypothetical protein